MNRDDEFARVLQENAELNDQVKRLVCLEAEVQRGREEMAAQCRLYRELFEAGHSFQNTRDPREIITVIIRFALYQANFQRCLALLPSNGSFRLAGSDGYYEEEDASQLAGLTVTADDPIVQRLGGGTALLLCPASSDDPDLRRGRELFGMDEYVIFPFGLRQSSLLGLLVAGNRAESAEYYARVEENSPLIAPLASLVTQAAAALVNIRLYQELQSERDLLEVRVDERAKQLNESEERLRVIVENTLDVIYALDTQGRITYASPSVHIWGYTPEELIGTNGLALVHPDDLGMVAANLEQAFTTGQVSPSYFRVFARDGRAVPVERHGRPLFRDGQIVGMAAVIRDISARQEMERALRDSETRYRTLVSNLAVGVYRNTGGPGGHFLEANPAIVRMFGYDSAEEFTKVAVSDLYQNPAERQRFVNAVTSQGSVRGYPLLLRRKDGVSFWASCTATAHWNAAGALEWMDGVLEDITERKRMEEELRDSQRRLSDILQFLPDATLVVDTQGRIAAWNRAMEKITGVPASEMLGKGDYEYAVPFYGERRPILIDKVLQRDEISESNYTNIRQEGDVWFAEGHAPGLGAGGWFEASATVLRDAEGRMVGAIETFRDTTERKRTDDALARARDAAEAANRAKSAFLAMMSHEIRTPMNAIIGMSGLLMDDGGLTPQQAEFAAAIRNSGESLLIIINDILDFSKIEAGRLDLENRPFELRLCVESALDLLAPRARDKGLELGCLMDAHTPSTLVGDPIRVNQILINLVGNAIKFTSAGEVVINVGARRLDGTAEHDGHFEVHFAIRDTGIGIPADRMDRLFQAFSQADSSTSRRYGGTGLGLAISKRLSEMMGGRIWAESEPGQGSTFHFTIVAPAAPAVKPVFLSGSQPALQGKHVLIVDDSSTARKILSGQMQSWGMVPRTASSGAEALICLCQGEHFDLIITDLHMPGMDGLQLGEAIKALPGAGSLPLVLLSSTSAESEPSRAARFKSVLVKPVKASRLYNSLMSIFGTAGPPLACATHETTSADSTMAATHPLRILLAEDNPTNQMLAQAMLQRLGYRADAAGNGREAVAALERQSYDAVLMDLQMPEMDGLEATREIRRRLPRGRQPRIIAMTADAMIEDREACFTAGMDDYISKPVLMENLVAALHRSTPLRAAAEAVSKIDEAALKRLWDTLGAQAGEMFPALLKSFESDGVRLLEACRRALEQRGAPELRRAAHTLKSTAATFGATELSSTAKQLEALARDEVFDGAQELIDRAQRLFERDHQDLAARSLKFER